MRTVDFSGIQRFVAISSSIIASYNLSRQLDSAVRIWSLMIIKGISLDVYCYNILINGYCKNQQLDKGLNLLKVMAMYSECPNPDIVTYNFGDNIFRFVQAGSEVSAFLGRMPSVVGYQTTLSTEMDFL
ncbi:hypothetical protein ZOSMA_13G01300 [Zostera marina]|uniref:Pentatricopeptide repeat-containing protein n=1 Tax=Zostera marina TaxID=29655 RepID=A0A0K9Q095_ZOSMR|nr:hypothetical protein ZOSMA_13G01300 [Zostera marina]